MHPLTNEIPQNDALLQTNHENTGTLPSGQEVTNETEKAPSMWEQAKDFIKTLWKVDFVRSIIYGIGAILALAGALCCLAAIPFTGGGSIVGLAVGVVALTILFDVLFAVSFSTLGASGNEFTEKYEAVVDKEKENKDDPDYKPSFAEFYAEPVFNGLLENEKQLDQLNQKAKEGLIKLKKEQAEVIKVQNESKILEANIKKAQENIDHLEKDRVNIPCRIEKDYSDIMEQLENLKSQLELELAKKPLDSNLVESIKTNIANLQLKKDEMDNNDVKSMINQKYLDNIQELKTNITKLDKEKDEKNQELGAKQDSIDKQFRKFLQEFDSMEKLTKK